MRKLQIRSMTAAVRAAGEEGEAPKVAGTGVVYDQWTEIFPGLRERIVRGAIEPAETVKSYFNHDPSMVLATQDSDPPLELKDGDDGLEYVSPIPDTTYGRDLAENLKRRNVQGSSFAFVVPEDGDRIWEDDAGVLHRDINRALLYEVGPVTDPAYVQTSADLRARAGEVQRAREFVEEYRANHRGTGAGSPELVRFNAALLTNDPEGEPQWIMVTREASERLQAIVDARNADPATFPRLQEREAKLEALRA